MNGASRNIQRVEAIIHIGIFGVVDWLFHVNVNAANRIHHADHRVEGDGNIGIDRDTEVVLNRFHGEFRAATRFIEFTDYVGGVNTLQLGLTGQRHVQIAGNAQHANTPGCRVDADDDQRIGAEASARFAGTLVKAHDEHRVALSAAPCLDIDGGIVRQKCRVGNQRARRCSG